MYNITLIATVHREIGICNSTELYKIIEQVNPDIIFEELFVDSFMAIYEGLRNDTLETKTIKRYLQKHRIKHIPVDIDGNKLIDIALKNDIEKMFDVFYNSVEYDKLLNQRTVSTEQQGFLFLNSSQCREIMERLHLLEEEILRTINNAKLFQTYKSWLEIINKRENEMIKNMYNYSTLTKYNRAIFLIGAEHKKPVKDKIPIFERKNKIELNWDFNYFKL
jgi:hypothetical protein